jgi:hypothetical protein
VSGMLSGQGEVLRQVCTRSRDIRDWRGMDLPVIPGLHRVEGAIDLPPDGGHPPIWSGHRCRLRLEARRRACRHPGGQDWPRTGLKDTARCAVSVA